MEDHNIFAPSGMLSPSRDRRDEEEWAVGERRWAGCTAMKMGVPHLVEWRVEYNHKQCYMEEY